MCWSRWLRSIFQLSSINLELAVLERMHLLQSASLFPYFRISMEYTYGSMYIYVCVCVFIYVTQVRQCEVSSGLRVQWESSCRLIWKRLFLKVAAARFFLSFSFIHVTLDGFYPSFSVPHILVTLLPYMCTSNCVAAIRDYGVPAGLDCWALC